MLCCLETKETRETKKLKLRIQELAKKTGFNSKEETKKEDKKTSKNSRVESMMERYLEMRSKQAEEEVAAREKLTHLMKENNGSTWSKVARVTEWIQDLPLSDPAAAGRLPSQIRCRQAATRGRLHAARPPWPDRLRGGEERGGGGSRGGRRRDGRRKKRNRKRMKRRGGRDGR
uniref:Uncharacterized protein n=1 Tax=Oryza barthii TaxID=65489 RepID=A0A0D3HL53_9ORYZ